MNLLHEEITGKILEACFEVINELGAGFLESVYEQALLIALHQKEIKAVSQTPIEVTFRRQVVGQYYADILVEDKIIVEIKAVSKLTEVHKAQVINYLHATGVDVGLLVNFGNPRLEYRRFNRKEMRFSKERIDIGDKNED